MKNFLYLQDSSVGSETFSVWPPSPSVSTWAQPPDLFSSAQGGLCSQTPLILQMFSEVLVGIYFATACNDLAIPVQSARSSTLWCLGVGPLGNCGLVCGKESSQSSCDHTYSSCTLPGPFPYCSPCDETKWIWSWGGSQLTSPPEASTWLRLNQFYLCSSNNTGWLECYFDSSRDCKWTGTETACHFIGSGWPRSGCFCSFC